jgi:catechol 2,3-dioxygenase
MSSSSVGADADSGRARFRLPASVRIGRVRLQVADLERSLGFYRDVIGFREIARADGTAELGAADGPTLLELAERPGVRPVPRSGLLGIYHFALLLPQRPDLGRFLRRQVREGVRFGAADHAFSEALYLEDPDGITIEVYADRPREAWTSEGRGLPLVSDPLDAAGLMGAAGSRDWDGVPSGAVVGHMHFFVDDLARAGDFYTALGFEPMIAIPSALFVAAGGYHHHVGLNTWRAGAPTASHEDARLMDWELRLPDADVLADTLASLDRVGYGPEPGRDRGVRVHDPWGVTVRLTT